ncbi:SprT family zinc-dependent metalloprotease [Marisediminitalea sp.]|uniref:SprT family zinc-dependent metalloprotease n=1 Tax=Marisediminitalea sp. TaxID=2662268 RepID=UPI003515633B
MINELDKTDIERRLEDLYARAALYFNRSFPAPLVTYRRSGKHAGTAFLQQNRINLHPTLFAHNKEAYFSDVIPHEVSHLLVYQIHGRVKPHGIEWQSMMSDVFGCEPNTRHTFDLGPLQLKSFTYACACGPVELSVRRHNAVMRGKQQYMCLQCGTRLTRLIEQPEPKTNCA